MAGSPAVRAVTAVVGASEKEEVALVPSLMTLELLGPVV